jgi:hypothetical protein
MKGAIAILYPVLKKSMHYTFTLCDYGIMDIGYSKQLFVFIYTCYIKHIFIGNILI